MTAPYVWHLWPARYWPTSVEEEVRFHADLRALAGPLSAHPQRCPRKRPQASEDARRQFRVHVTAVLNALRSGLPAAELVALVPGTPVSALHEAYDMLEGLRAQAHADWLTIVGDPQNLTHPATLRSASRLLPIPLHRIATRNTAAGGDLPAAVLAAAAQVAGHGALVHEVEKDLALSQSSTRQAIELGARLHNPLTPALWGSAYYLPRRVTDLSPTRVADLLNERNLKP